MTSVPATLFGRVAVITGGASGIGRATAMLLAEQGVRVFIGDYRLRSENQQVYQALGIEAAECDVRKVDDLKRLIDNAASATGRLDILVNNAGIGMVKQITAVTEADWDNVLDTNLKAAFLARSLPSRIFYKRAAAASSTSPAMLACSPELTIPCTRSARWR